MKRPNVLVVFCDQLKAATSHLYGNPDCVTPSLEKLADEGVLFRHACTPHPLCVPARCALWTGRWPHANGSRRNETLMQEGQLHAFQLWKARGYRTGLIGKNHCFDRAEDLDLFDVWCEITHGGRTRVFPNKGMEWFRTLEQIDAGHAMRRNMPQQGPRLRYGSSDFPLEDYSTGLIAGQTERFLEQHAAEGEHGDEPFALWVSIPDPHSPYEAPKKYTDMFPPDRITLPPKREGEMRDAPERNQVIYGMLGMEDDPDEYLRGALATYYAMTRFIDDGVGQIMATLDRLGLRENTIVVFTADHGDFSGEHDMMRKGGVFYDCLTRIPMIVSWPGHVPEGAVDESMVNLVDVVPTLFALSGQEVPRSMQGAPMPTVTDAAPRTATFSEYGCGGPPFTMEHLRRLATPTGLGAIGRSLQWREAEGRRKMVRTAEWKYVHDSMGDRDELYDLVNDPWELTNVVDDPANAAVLADLRLRLADWSIDTEGDRPCPLPDPEKYEIFAD